MVVSEEHPLNILVVIDKLVILLISRFISAEQFLNCVVLSVISHKLLVLTVVNAVQFSNIDCALSKLFSLITEIAFKLVQSLNAFINDFVLHLEKSLLDKSKNILSAIFIFNI